jgi:hypothetical protein
VDHHVEAVERRVRAVELVLDGVRQGDRVARVLEGGLKHGDATFDGVPEDEDVSGDRGGDEEGEQHRRLRLRTQRVRGRRARRTSPGCNIGV